MGPAVSVWPIPDETLRHGGTGERPGGYHSTHTSHISATEVGAVLPAGLHRERTTGAPAW